LSLVNAQQCKGQVQIDINNDEPLQTIWEHMSEITRGGGDIIKLINLNLLYHYSHLFLTFSRLSLNLNLKIYLAIKVHSMNPKVPSLAIMF